MIENNSDHFVLGGWGISPELLTVMPSALAEKPILLDYGKHQLSFNDAVEQMSEKIIAPITLSAWSFGGLLAIALASKHPEKIKRLILFSSSPRFLNDESWDGISTKDANAFLALAEKNPEYLQDYFLALVKYPSRRVDIDKATRQLSHQTNLPYWRDLLFDLFNKDLRKEYIKLSMPVLHIIGGKDGILKQNEIQLKKLNNKATSFFIKNSGHLSFLSHKKQVRDKINNWLNET